VKIRVLHSGKRSSGGERRRWLLGAAAARCQRVAAAADWEARVQVCERDWVAQAAARG
jgi:hypothetical protein